MHHGNTYGLAYCNYLIMMLRERDRETERETQTERETETHRERESVK